MSVTLYFLKINVNSHIYDVYEDKEKLWEILNLVFFNMRENVSYKKENLNYVENGEKYPYEADYKISFIEKYDDNTIYGRIIKSSVLFVNEVGEEEVLNKVPVPYSEVNEFFFDVNNEVVAFYTTNRFRYADFTLAFQELLNRCMITESEEYFFEVSLLREGLSVEDIQSQLKKIGKIETIKIDIIPPNPDDDLLDGIIKNGEEFITDMEEGNITHTSSIFTSKESTGLNIDARLIQSEFKKINNIHSKLTDKKATQNGYVTVEARSKNGRFYSTNDNNPIKDRIDDRPRSVEEFAKECKRKITNLINSF